MNVYLETNLWNALCDHPVDADTLVGSLGARAITLDFSDHCVTEMARTFQGYGTAADRGRQLFSCLRRFVDAGARCTKQNMELIPAELTALTSRTEVEPFLSAKEHAHSKQRSTNWPAAFSTRLRTARSMRESSLRGGHAKLKSVISNSGPR